MLAYAVLLHDPAPRPFIGIEEPGEPRRYGHGAHPGRGGPLGRRDRARRPTSTGSTRGVAVVCTR
jgi:hypothetical protein